MVVCGLLVKTFLCAFTLTRLLSEPKTEREKDELLATECPATYLLSQHALLHDCPGGTATEVLEAGTEIVVHEVRPVSVGRWERMCSLRRSDSVWGRIKQPSVDVKEVWVLLFQDTPCVAPPGTTPAQ